MTHIREGIITLAWFQVFTTKERVILKTSLKSFFQESYKMGPQIQIKFLSNCAILGADESSHISDCDPSQVPQPTCSRYLHPDPCQSGNPTMRPWLKLYNCMQGVSGPRARCILIRLVFSSSYYSTMQLGVPSTSGSWTGTGLGIGQQSLCLTLVLIPDLGNIFEPIRYSYSDSLMGLWLSDLPT